MATLALVFAGTWITDPVTLTSLQLFKTGREESDDLDVSVRIYARGRRRIITTPKIDRSTSMTFRGVSASDLETLRGWRGQILLLRDVQGWRRWGTFKGVQFSTTHPAPMAPLYEVTLTWLDSDYIEGL